MSTIREVQQEIIEEFEDFPDWMDRWSLGVNRKFFCK